MISSSRHRILWFRSNRLSTCCRSWIFLPFCSVLSRHIHSNDYITTRDFRNGVLKRHRQSAIYTRITKVERKHWDGSSDLHITCVVPWQRDDRWWPGGRDPIFENLRSFVVTRKKKRDMNVDYHFHGGSPFLRRVPLSLSREVTRKGRRITGLCVHVNDGSDVSKTGFRGSSALSVYVAW